MLGNDSCLSPIPSTGRPQTGCHQALPLIHMPQTCGFQLDKDGEAGHLGIYPGWQGLEPEPPEGQGQPPLQTEQPGHAPETDDGFCFCPSSLGSCVIFTLNNRITEKKRQWTLPSSHDA